MSVYVKVGLFYKIGLLLYYPGYHPEYHVSIYFQRNREIFILAVKSDQVIDPLSISMRQRELPPLGVKRIHQIHHHGGDVSRVVLVTIFVIALVVVGLIVLALTHRGHSEEDHREEVSDDVNPLDANSLL